MRTGVRAIVRALVVWMMDLSSVYLEYRVPFMNDIMVGLG